MKPFELDKWWIIPSNLKAIFGDESQKGIFWLDLVIFKRKMIGIFGTHHQIRIPLSKEQIKEPWKARLHFINFQPMFEDQKIEVDLILRISPYLLWISFDFLFLEYQIHCFRIWNWL